MIDKGLLSNCQSLAVLALVGRGRLAKCVMLVVKEKAVMDILYDLLTLWSRSQVYGLDMTQNKPGDENMALTSGQCALYVLRYCNHHERLSCGTRITLAKMSRTALIERVYIGWSYFVPQAVLRPGTTGTRLRPSNSIHGVFSSLK